eukprot:TRINITY_DN6444_c0_g1_i1.p1 TRINITY_DN6444_c0_g1~~TRINITY_DN6444_c0_g1_i1.p1  ORF type:complete len:238 (-),score=69.74 TRINITY_DN6444_c0_g1_i1:37-750(-)
MDRTVIESGDCPLIHQFLDPGSKEHWEDVLEGLNLLGIKFKINPYLVRGLDYYTDTCFEFTTKKLGAQSSVLAGGRYDGLANTIGGVDIPGMGWALGVERIAPLLDLSKCVLPEERRGIAVIPICTPEDNPEISQQVFRKVLKLSQTLRESDLEAIFISNMSYTSGETEGQKQKSLVPLGNLIKRANKQNCIIAVLMGSKELMEETCVVQLLDLKEKQTVKLKDLICSLKKQLNKPF